MLTSTAADITANHLQKVEAMPVILPNLPLMQADKDAVMVANVLSKTSYPIADNAGLVWADGELASLPSEGSHPYNVFNWGDWVKLSDLSAAGAAIEAGTTALTQVRNVFLWNAEYLKKHPALRRFSGPFGVGVGIVNVALAVRTAASLSVTLHFFITEKRSASAIGSTVVYAAGGFSSLAATSFKELHGFTLILKPLKGIAWFGPASVVFGGVGNALYAGAEASRVVTDSATSTTQKVFALTELSLQISGDMTNLVLNAMLVKRAAAIARGVAPVTSVLSKVTVFGGILAATLATTLNPFALYYAGKELQYAANLEKLALEFSKQGYDGHQLLADFYRAKGTFDIATTSARTVIAMGNAAFGIAFLASVVGAPLAAAVSVASAVLTGAIDASTQAILEKMADKCRASIIEWEKTHANSNYFSNGLDVYYRNMQAQLQSVLAVTQKALGVEQIVAVTQVNSDAQFRELAAITRMAEKLKSGQASINAFDRGLVIESQYIALDEESGVINLSSDKLSQALIFTTPLLTPGVEQKTRTKEGKNRFMTTLNFLAREGWKIDCGDASTTTDFSKVVQYARLADGTKRSVNIDAKMGYRDDCVIAGVGAMNIRGDAGVDTVNYSKLADVGAYIHVTVNADGHYLVNKTITNASMYEEVVVTEKQRIGKRTESIQYRDVKLVTADVLESTDVLQDIETLIGTSGNDRFYGGGNAGMMFDGGAGHDHIEGSEQDDVLVGGLGDDTLIGLGGHDILEGNEGNDTYRFGRGHGQDYICDLDNTLNNCDVLQIDGDITLAQLAFEKSDGDLKISIVDTMDSITIAGWFIDKAYCVEEIRCGNEVMLHTQVDALLSSMAAMPVETSALTTAAAMNSALATTVLVTPH